MDEDPKDRIQAIFFQTVGNAISTWAAMESLIVATASVLLGTSLRKAGLVFYSIQNFHVWLNVVDELFLLEEKYRDKRSEWTHLSDRLRRLNDIRVRLAHQTSIRQDAGEINSQLRHQTFSTSAMVACHFSLAAQSQSDKLCSRVF